MIFFPGGSGSVTPPITGSTTLPLTPIVNITYSLSGVSAPRANFNLGLIIGTSTVISNTDRVRVFSSVSEMITSGFSTSSPEYLAAVQYFSVSPAPTQVAIGRQVSGTETPLQAVQACRAVNNDWYMVYVPSASNTDHVAIANYIEALTEPYSTYILQSSDNDVKNNVANNLFATMKTANFNRTLGIFSTSAHAAAALMGIPMSLTSDLTNSAYTLAFKSLPGTQPEQLTTQQVNNIEGNNGNVYINRGGFYEVTEKGTMFSGTFFDEVIYRDKLVNDIQLNVMDLIYNSPKIPQTEDGMASVRAVVANACEKMRQIGFISGGTWKGQTILTLKLGDELPNGYRVLSDAISSQSQSDRSNRIAPNIYVAILLAGAIHSVLIKVSVNR
jgi:hypothetical protein